MLFRVIDSIIRAAFFSVKHGNDSGRVVDHPLIPNLETSLAIMLADKDDMV